LVAAETKLTERNCTDRTNSRFITLPGLCILAFILLPRMLGE
jgi:hypothetical protein